MREILFRGKRRDNGEWILGQLIRYEDGRARIVESGENIFCYEMDISIIQTVSRHVDPETVGQYTGLTANGKKIFEGDIVQADNGHTSKVVFWHGRFCLYCECHKQYSNSIPNDIVEVIGNIHDNPELLEVSHE